MKPTFVRLARIATTGALVTIIVACGSGAPPTAGPSLGATGAPSAAGPQPTAAVTPGPTMNTSTVVGPGERWLAATNRSSMISLVRLDGSGEHVVFPLVPSGQQHHPDWSPDGGSLSFTLRGETDVIWIGDVDGSNTRLAADCQAPCVWAHEAAWSPDGTSLVYSRMVLEDGIGVSTLEIVNLDTNETRVVLTAPKRQFFGQPRWSPDGSKVVTEIAYMPVDNLDGFPDGVALAIVDVTAADPTLIEITEPETLSNSPDWSWATDLIVFAMPTTEAAFDGPSDLVTIHPDGSEPTTLISVAPREGQTPQPAWLPDGLRIVFVQPDTTMLTVAADGTDLQPAISEGFGRGIHPRYRPVP